MGNKVFWWPQSAVETNTTTSVYARDEHGVYRLWPGYDVPQLLAEGYVEISHLTAFAMGLPS